MADMLKGNYKVAKPVFSEPSAEAADVTSREFERRALERLGGSIAFVTTKNFVWSGPKKSE